jgi:hemerythrin
MKPLIDLQGNKIIGVFKKEDGSFVSIGYESYIKNKNQHDAFTQLNNEVIMLKQQVQQILESLNGKY